MSTKLSHADSNRAIIKSTSILSSGTLVSRILGFIRDIVLANLLGTKVAGDAFFVAFKIPNLFRSFVGEGATNSAVVPILSRYVHDKEKYDFWNFLNIIFSISLVVLSGITLLGMIFTPAIVRLLAPGFLSDPEKFTLSVNLTRIIFPYLIFIGLTAYSMAVLYTFRSFVVPALSPCLLNIAIILSAAVASRFMEQPVYGLAIGVLIGGMLQFGVYILPLRKVGMRYRRPRSLKHPGLKEVFRLLVPRVIGSGVYQLTVLIDTLCASLSAIVGLGGISAIYYSNRIVQLPMGLFSVSLASALLPSLSTFASKKDYDSIKRALVFALENILFIMCPVIVYMIIFSNPIIRIFFERGAFTTYSTKITSAALLFYSLGLFCFGGIKVLVSAFHAMEDTRTPVKVAGVCLFLNGILNFLLMYPLKIGGIALASSIAGTINYLVLYNILKRRLGGFNSHLSYSFFKVTVVSVLTGLLAHWVWRMNFMFPEMIKLFLVSIVSLVFYIWLSCVFQVKQSQKIWEWISRKKKNHD